MVPMKTTTAAAATTTTNLSPSWPTLGQQVVEDDDFVWVEQGARDAPKGVQQLGHEARLLILQNLQRLALHLDLDGTLTAGPGQAMEERAIQVLKRLQALGVPVSCHTPHCHDTLVQAAHGHDVFAASVTEGLRVQHADGTVVRLQPPNFAWELETLQEFLMDRPSFAMMVLRAEESPKTGSFVLELSREGRSATPFQIKEVLVLIEEMANDNDELTFALKEGARVEFCSKWLSNKRYGASEQMSRAPFRNCFSIGAGCGDVAANDGLFQLCDLPIQVGRCRQRRQHGCGDAQVRNHRHLLDVLEWIANVREGYQLPSLN